jgi:hypothetical protein
MDMHSIGRREGHRRCRVGRLGSAQRESDLIASARSDGPGCREQARSHARALTLTGHGGWRECSIIAWSSTGIGRAAWPPIASSSVSANRGFHRRASPQIGQTAHREAPSARRPPPATGRLAQRHPMVRRPDEVGPLASAGRLPFDQIINVAEHRAMVHRDRPVTRDGGTSLGHHLAIGNVQEFEQAHVFHPIAVQFQ